MLKIAIPNKGSLSEEAVTLIREAGYNCKRYSRELMVSDNENNVEFVFLRPRDIAIYVSNGIIDLGITGRDLAIDSLANIEEVLPLGFGKSSFYYAAPVDSGLTVDKFSNTRIATSYPNLVKKDLKERGIDASVVKLDGAIEISIRLGVADAVADVVQTGKTMEEAGLCKIGDPVMKSEAVVVARNKDIVEESGIKTFLERLKGIVVAREYVIVEYDVSVDSLDKAISITPGIEAPTVAPLSKEGWVAVKAMTKKKKINPIMDELSSIGAKGIMVTDIRTCRM